MVFGVSKILGGFMAVLEKIASWVGALFSIIPKLLYLLITFAMQIVDIIQILFQKLAGLDVYYIEGSDNPETGDFLVYFLRKVLFEKGTLNTVFWSIVILGLFLLVFATIVAVIRTQYNYDDGKPVSPTKIVGKALKSLLSFAIVPIVAFFGVYLGNIFLQALNSATQTQPSSIQFAADAKIKLKPYTLANGKKTYAGVNLFGKNLGINNETFSGMVFRAAAYRANRIRNNTADFRELCDGSKETMAGALYSGVTFGMFEVTASDYETAAKRLDDAFVYNYRLDQLAFVNWKASAQIGLTMSVGALFNDFTALLYASPYQTFNRYNVAWVWYYYDLWQFDFVLAIISIVAIAIIYLNITSAMMKRAIELTMLMILSPAVIAVTPLDNGEMQKRWRTNFIKKTLSAYGAVVGVNLLFIILPEINKVNFFSPDIPIVNTIVQLLFTIVGLTCIKDFMKMLSELAGGEDANAIGGEINKKVAETAMKAGTVAASVAAPAAGLMKKVVGNSLLGVAGKKIGGKIGGKITSSLEKRREKKREKLEEKAKEETIKRLMAKRGYTRARAEQMFDRASYNVRTAWMNTSKEKLLYKRNRADADKIREQYIKKLKEENPTKTVAELNREADAYMTGEKGQQAVREATQQRRKLESPLRFMGTLAGQIAEGVGGDKMYDGFKSMRNASQGKSTSAFFGARDKEAKENAARKAEQDHNAAVLSAQKQTNELLNQLINKLS